MELPKPLPKALAKPAKPEVTVSPALSLTALPGDGGIRTRKIAILVADGVDGHAVATLQTSLLAEGAVPRLVGFRVGPVATEKGEPIEADASLENSPAVLFDAMVLPPGDAAAQALAASGQVNEFIQNQYRHGKTLLALGAARSLLEAHGIDAPMPNGEADPGVLLAQGVGEAIEAFIEAVGKHRHPARETDPPRV